MKKTDNYRLSIKLNSKSSLMEQGLFAEFFSGGEYLVKSPGNFSCKTKFIKTPYGIDKINPYQYLAYELIKHIPWEVKLQDLFFLKRHPDLLLILFGVQTNRVERYYTKVVEVLSPYTNTFDASDFRRKFGESYLSFIQSNNCHISIKGDDLVLHIEANDINDVVVFPVFPQNLGQEVLIDQDKSEFYGVLHNRLVPASMELSLPLMVRNFYSLPSSYFYVKDKRNEIYRPILVRNISEYLCYAESLQGEVGRLWTTQPELVEKVRSITKELRLVNNWPVLSLFNQKLSDEEKEYPAFYIVNPSIRDTEVESPLGKLKSFYEASLVVDEIINFTLIENGKKTDTPSRYIE